MKLGKSSNHIRKRRGSRRMELKWNNETKKHFMNLKQKSVDIKDFSKYRSSDVENITLLNTLINGYISKLYNKLPKESSTSPTSNTIVNESKEEQLNTPNETRSTNTESNLNNSDTKEEKDINNTSKPNTSSCFKDKSEEKDGETLNSITE